MEWLFEVAKIWGPATALVCWVLYTNWIREQRYLGIVQTLSEEVKERLTKIETMVKKIH
jgi:hypothetical protein